jgi:hypothetical protein
MKTYSAPRTSPAGTFRFLFFTSLLTVFVCGFGFAEEGQWKVSTGFDYSTGDYNDTADTEMFYVPFGIGYSKGSWSGKISTGWLYMDGPGSVIDGGVVLPGSGTNRTESGIADTWVALTYEIDAVPAEIGFFDVTGKVKIPTADDDKGLGTGEIDYAVQLDYMYVAGNLTPMLTVGYKFKGDPPGVDLNNVLYLSAGADLRLSDNTHIGASLDFQEASTSGIDDPLELFTYLNHKLNDNWSLLPYIYVGLSESSPDVGGGLQLVFKP